MKEIDVKTAKRVEFINITGLVRESVKALELRQGAVTVFVPHTTAGITINENADPDVLADLEQALEKMVPRHADYCHAEGNSAAHVKASLLGSSVRVLVADGRLQLGQWQGVFFCEFDGPRRRKIWIDGVPGPQPVGGRGPQAMG